LQNSQCRSVAVDPENEGGTGRDDCPSIAAIEDGLDCIEWNLIVIGSVVYVVGMLREGRDAYHQVEKWTYSTYSYIGRNFVSLGKHGTPYSVFT